MPAPRRLIAILLRGAVVAAAIASTALPLAAVHAHDAVRGASIYLVSSRALGTRCECGAMCAGLHCEALVPSAEGDPPHWRTLPWNELAAELTGPTPTLVYVHGNRVEPGEDKLHGLALYRALAARTPADAPLRYIIWSWPSAKVPGVVKDYQEKAARTPYVAWQLAWAVDQAPAETPLSLVGYSYGARVVTGSLHLLAGGRLGELELTERVHPVRPPLRAALVAAAVDADWVRPGGPHGRALEVVERMLVIQNQHDPAMRFYHMAFEGRRRPLGYAGPAGLHLGAFADRVLTLDVTDAVGRHHALSDYLAATGRVSSALAATTLQPPLTPVENVSLAERLK